MAEVPKASKIPALLEVDEQLETAKQLAALAVRYLEQRDAVKAALVLEQLEEIVTELAAKQARAKLSN